MVARLWAITVRRVIQLIFMYKLIMWHVWNKLILSNKVTSKFSDFSDQHTIAKISTHNALCNFY